MCPEPGAAVKSWRFGLGSLGPSGADPVRARRCTSSSSSGSAHTGRSSPTRCRCRRRRRCHPVRYPHRRCSRAQPNRAEQRRPVPEHRRGWPRPQRGVVMMTPPTRPSPESGRGRVQAPPPNRAVGQREPIGGREKSGMRTLPRSGRGQRGEVRLGRGQCRGGEGNPREGPGPERWRKG